MKHYKMFRTLSIYLFKVKETVKMALLKTFFVSFLQSIISKMASD